MSGHADALEQFRRACRHPPRNAEEQRAARQGQREQVAHRQRQPGVEGEPLRDVADVLGVRLRVVVAAVELDLAAVRVLADQGAQERGLAGAVQPDERR